MTPAVFDVVAATADGAAGSLRDAINQSDTNGDADNLINLAAGSYSLTDQASGDLRIDDQAAGIAAKTLTISGAGAGGTIIDAGQLHNRVFQIVSSQGAAVTVSFLQTRSSVPASRGRAAPEATAAMAEPAAREDPAATAATAATVESAPAGASISPRARSRP